MQAAPDAGTGKPARDSFTSGAGGYAQSYPQTAGYPTETTGYGQTTGYRQEPGYDTGYVDPAVSATPGYSSTEYASTGTGTPVPVDEDYPGAAGRPGFPGGSR